MGDGHCDAVTFAATAQAGPTETHHLPPHAQAVRYNGDSLISHDVRDPPFGAAGGASAVIAGRAQIRSFVRREVARCE